MSVARELGLGEGLGSASLTEASRCWPRWCAEDAALSGPEGVAGLASWLRSAGPAEADRVLHGLVRIGSPTGADEPLAVDVVTWALLPGARALAGRLRGLSPEVDRLVAGQLWLEVRTFPWQRLRKVAGNVLANTRARVLAGNLPMSGGRPRIVECRVVDPHSVLWEQAVPHDPGPIDAAVELGAVLSDAARQGVLATRERDLLRVLLEQAHVVGGGGSRRGRGGLLADRVVDGVVETTGLSPATVRRRVRRSVLTIAEAQRAELIEAA